MDNKEIVHITFDNLIKLAYRAVNSINQNNDLYVVAYNAYATAYNFELFNAYQAYQTYLQATNRIDHNAAHIKLKNNLYITKMIKYLILTYQYLEEHVE